MIEFVVRLLMTRKYSKELNPKGEEVWFMLNKIFKLFFQVNNKYDSFFDEFIEKII